MTIQDSLSNQNYTPSIIEKVYSGVALRNINNIKKGFGRVLQLINTPWLNDQEESLKSNIFKANMAQLKESIDKIPEEKVCEVPPEIGVPIVEKLSYTTNEHIKRAYINLLTKATSEDTVDVAHPAFEGIISRLSADEARIIEFLKGKIEVKFVDYRLNTQGNGWYYRRKFATGIEFDIELDFPNNIEAYTNNLITLGIFSYTPGNHKIGENEYDYLTKKYVELESKLNVEINDQLIKKIDFTAAANSHLGQETKDRILKAYFTKLETIKGFFDITPFGQLFIKACTE